VYLACDTRFCAAGLSRHCTLLRVPDLKGQGLVDGLLSIAGRIGEKAVLILSSDLQVVAVSRARAALEAHYFVALPTEAMVDVLVDKASFQAYAEEIGLRVPRAVVLDQSHDEQALDVLSMPVVVKPADKALVLAGVVDRATRADTLAEARAVARRMRCAASSVVVQEWIDGDDDDIYFTLFVCDEQARIVALFTGRKMICAPPLVGSTALCVAATEEHEALAAQTQAFVAHSHYHGIGGLEFKRDRRTGQFVVVEPTVGRADWQEEIATLCGVNIPAIAYRTARGQPVESVGPIDPAVAWRASFRYRPRAGTLPPGTRCVDGYFRRTDPLPGLYGVYTTVITPVLARLTSRFVKQRRSRPVAEPIPA
jgi:D-aspartate ligase